jgi:hypothetical protein
MGTSSIFAVALHPRLPRLQPDQPRDRGAGAPARPRLQPAAQQDQRDDHRRGLEIDRRAAFGQQPGREGRHGGKAPGGAVPMATRLFMSGAPRASAGRPWRKNCSPGPNSTSVVSTNWMTQLSHMPMVSMHPVMEGRDQMAPHLQHEDRQRQRRGDQRQPPQPVHLGRLLVGAGAAGLGAARPRLVARRRAPPPPAARPSPDAARCRTVAVSAARLTVAAPTPGTALSARSTRPTQDAQVIPVTCRIVCSSAADSRPRPARRRSRADPACR